MTSKVFVSVTMSLDGYIGPRDDGASAALREHRHDDPSLQRWMTQWTQLQQWVFPQKFFRENLKLGEGGKDGRDSEILEEIYNRTGVSIMGKRMFDGGEVSWPEEAPFHTPVFVVTNQQREPWVRPGGTTFHFVDDGIENALKQAREVVDGRDIRIAGGGNTIVQYLNAGLVDELSVALTPVLFGSGVRLFGGIDPDRVALDLVRTEPSEGVTHLTYAVRQP